MPVHDWPTAYTSSRHFPNYPPPLFPSRAVLPTGARLTCQLLPDILFSLLHDSSQAPHVIYQLPMKVFSSTSTSVWAVRLYVLLPIKWTGSCLLLSTQAEVCHVIYSMLQLKAETKVQGFSLPPRLLPLDGNGALCSGLSSSNQPGASGPPPL